jgi:ElaB/YqjD/DUF883 family membrane-anchored ribosome-binding protein
MVERTDELRDDIERRRREIGGTVDELQNRVSPRRVMARGRYRARRWVIDTRDRIMGNEDPYYPWQERESEGSERKEESMKDRVSEIAAEVTDRASHAASEAKEAVTRAPQMVRQQARGNPMAAGLIAFGGGLLLGSFLPETSTEHDIARRMEPAVSGAMSEAREVGRDVIEDVKEDAEDAMEQVKDKASEAGQHLKDDTKEAAERTRERAQG